MSLIDFIQCQVNDATLESLSFLQEQSYTFKNCSFANTRKAQYGNKPVLENGSYDLTHFTITTKQICDW